VTEPDEQATPSSAIIPMKPEGPAQHKSAKQRKKDSEVSHEDTDSLVQKKPSQVYRDPGRRRGKN